MKRPSRAPTLPAGNVVKNRLASVIRSLAEKKRCDLERLKEGQKHWSRHDFIWHSLLGSFSTMGNARGAELMRDNELYSRVSWEAISRVPRRTRLKTLCRTLSQAKVRMAEKKAAWLNSNFERIREAGGPEAIKRQLEDSSGCEGKIVFLRSFKGIGPKYARNIMMDVYHPDFRNSVAVDARINMVSQALGLAFESYEEEEDFCCSVAHAAEVQPWELDRLIWNFQDEVMNALGHSRKDRKAACQEAGCDDIRAPK
jgi:hypothetical protein